MYVAFENDVPFEADLIEAVKAKKEETVEESKTKEDALVISKAVVVKTPLTEVEEEE